MKFCAMLIFTCLLFSCNNQDKKQNNSTENQTVENILPDTSIPIVSVKVVAPAMEEAETIIAKYYSARNREKKYPYYKGLGLQILSTNRISGTDSFLIKASVSGRIWNNPNKDTLTVPFHEIRNIRAVKDANGWQADSLSSR